MFSLFMLIQLKRNEVFMKLKYVAWIIRETKEDENTKQDKITEETSFISMPTEQSLFEEIEVNEEKHELVQKYLQNKFAFAGNLLRPAAAKSLALSLNLLISYSLQLVCLPSFWLFLQS